MKVLEIFVRWITRKRPVWQYLLSAGVTLIVVAVVGGLLIGVNYLDGIRAVSVSIDRGSTPDWIAILILLLGTISFALGVFIAVADWWSLRTNNKRSLYLAVEIRGLRDLPESSLAAYLTKNRGLAYTALPVDLREGIVDGKITSPSHAIDKVLGIPEQIKTLANQYSPDDVRVAFGGLAPVPLTFLAGALLDDERKVEMLDWNRHKLEWSSLKEADDGERFELHGLDLEQDINSAEVCLSVSMSYKVQDAPIVSEFPHLPLINLYMNVKGLENHWSEEKQQELGKQFIELITRLGQLDVKKIHLFMAAQSSLVFRFGKLLDLRNMPVILIYQYDRDCEFPYSWAIRLPGDGVKADMVECSKIQ